jgi:hypothetical protein
MPAMRIAAITTFDKASLFLDSVVGSSGCVETVATCDRVERLLWPSGTPLRLMGRVSDERLGERDNWREAGRDGAPFAEAGLDSVNGDGLVSKDRDLRWAKDDCDSVPRATAAAIPAPPFPLAFLFAIVASSKISRFRFGESGAVCDGRNWASVIAAPSSFGASRAGIAACLCRRGDESGSACTRSAGSWASGCSGDGEGGVGKVSAAEGAIVP